MLVSLEGVVELGLVALFFVRVQCVARRMLVSGDRRHVFSLERADLLTAGSRSNFQSRVDDCCSCGQNVVKLRN